MPRHIFFLAALISICGCHKTPVIWGTWTEASTAQLCQTRNTITCNNTTYITPGSIVFTFTVNGGYYATNSNGRYILNGTKLQLTDTTLTPPQSNIFLVSTLTHRLLVLQQTDTIAFNPLNTVRYTYTLVPQ